MKFFLILTILFTFGVISDAQTLPSSIKNYLDRNYPKWKAVGSDCSDKNKGEWLFTADFNSDGKADHLVSIGEGGKKKDKKHLLIAFLGQSDSFQPMLVAKVGFNILYGFQIWKNPVLGNVKDRVELSQCYSPPQTMRLSTIYEYRDGRFVIAVQT